MRTFCTSVYDIGIAAIFAGFFLSCVRTWLCFGIFSRLWIYAYHKAGVQTHKCQNGDRSKSIAQFTLLFITVGVRSSNDVLIAEDTV